MIFDDATSLERAKLSSSTDGSNKADIVFNKGKINEASYSRTAHSEGEMFGLSKFPEHELFGVFVVVIMWSHK